MYFDESPMSYVRASRAAVFATVCVLFLAVVGLAGAAGAQGWTAAKANAYIETNVRIVDPAVVAAAKEAQWTNLQPAGVAGGQLALQRAKSGQDVRAASCVGVTSGATGYVSFSCALLLSDRVGYNTTAFGELKRVPSGDWRWTTAAYSRTAS
jgi:hypothetical protein